MKTTRTAMTEQLEARRMFSVAASDAAGTLYVYGDNSNNGLTVATSGTDLVVKKYAQGSGYTEFYRVKQTKVDTIRMYGRGGDDTLTIGSGIKAHSVIAGEGGADYMESKVDGASAIYGHAPAGSGTPDDNAADTLIFGSLQDGSLYGQGGADHFLGGNSAGQQPTYATGTDYAYGGAGNDRFDLGTGGRLVYFNGDAGDDRVNVSRDRSLVFTGGAGSDTVDFSSYKYAASITLKFGVHSGRLDGDDRRMSFKSDVENAVGTEYGDKIYGNDANNALAGNGGSDTVEGGKGNDTIDGGYGVDYLKGGAGQDTIHGGSDDDYIHGGDDNDKVYGDAGDDTLTGDFGNDLIVGGTGSDSISSRDYVYANDIVYGGNQDMTGTAGYDTAEIDGKTSIIRDLFFNVDKLI